MRKRKTVPIRIPEGWTVSTEFSWNSRRIEPGTQLSILKHRGRVLFVRHVDNGKGGQWVDVKDQSGRFRSFHPDRIKTVHRLAKPTRVMSH